MHAQLDKLNLWEPNIYVNYIYFPYTLFIPGIIYHCIDLLLLHLVMG
jgi:hypothetical protein